MSEQDRKDQNARPEDKDVPGLVQVEVPDPAHQQIADSKVEEAPQDIDRRGRQPDTGRGREGTLEGMARDPIAEMGQRVREEGAPEEVGQVVVPAHDCLYAIAVADSEPVILRAIFEREAEAGGECHLLSDMLQTGAGGECHLLSDRLRVGPRGDNVTY